MTPPEPFPEKEAAAVLAAAEEVDFWMGGGVYVVAVTTMLDMVRDILGDHTVPTRLATAWGDGQAVPSGVANDLSTSLGSLDVYWDSGAFDAFNTHTGRVIAACDTTAAKMADIGTLLAEAIGLVFETWSGVVAYIIRSAGACAGLFDPLGWPGVITDLVSNVADLVEKAIDTMGGYQTNVVAVDIAAAGFPTPAELPPEVADPDKWQVADAPPPLPD